MHARSGEEMDNPMREAASVYTGHQRQPETLQDSRIGFSAPTPPSDTPAPSETVTEGEIHGLEWKDVQQSMYGAPTPPTPYGYQQPQPVPYGYQQPQPVPYGYQQPQPPQPAWSGGNYQSGYVNRALRSNGPSNFMGQQQQNSPPWVASTNINPSPNTYPRW